MNVNPFSYLIEKLKGKVDKSGDTMSGDLTLGKASTVLKIRGADKYANLTSSVTSSDKNIALPDKSGTIALTSDIPNIDGYKNGNPASSYSFSVSLDSGNRPFIVMTRYCLFWGSVIDNANVEIALIHQSPSSPKTLNSATYSDGVVTLNFSGAIYGGVTVIF